MDKKPFYITTTLPYVNAEPHIGFAMEIIRADIIARAKKLAGYEVFFNTGTDEHGLKVQQSAKQLNLDPQAYVDQVSAKFKEVLPVLGVALDEPGITFNFIRTTDPHHVKAAGEFWKLVEKNGKKAADGPYIYKKDYSAKYCVGCELEKTESELVNGRCPLHPLSDLEIIEEENYFFKFSAFQQKLLDLYEGRAPYEGRSPLVVPDFRFNEIKAFVSRGLEDFSISRLKEKMVWGVPVPDDDKHVMYVWFDALVDYISAIGWPDDEVKDKKDAGAFKKWWIDTGGVVQYCGKDNLRQQSAIWQAMLMAAGLPPSKTIVIDGFITGDGGLKMSKSLGNTVDPLDIVKEYGTDALRYYVAREISPFEDSPFTVERFREAYNANLANGIGNLTSRIMKMAEANLDGVSVADVEMPKDYQDSIAAYDLKAAMDIIWSKTSSLDGIIQREQPFKLIKEDEKKGQEVITKMVKELFHVAKLLEPFLPSTSLKIQECVRANKMPAEPLFMRK
jgi:methionyl-tRNA synthetase